MRILVANKFYWPKGGSERVMFDLSGAWERAGHEVAPFSMASAENRATPWARHFVPEVRYEDVRGLGKLGAAARSVWSRDAHRRITAMIREFRPDVAHLHNIHHQLSPSIVDALREAGVPTVHTLHDYQLVCPNYLMYTEGRPCERCLSGRFHHAVTHRCVRGSRAASAVAALEMTLHRVRRTMERGVARFVSPSRFLAGKLSRAGFPPAAIRVVPNGVRPEEFPPAERAGSGFLYAGRLSVEKGVGSLLQAVAATESLRLTVAGTGPEEPLLRELAARIAPGRIDFVGHLDRPVLLEAVRASRAVVLPSEWYENAPLSALEAMASGVPVVAADLGGLPEIVRDGKTGVTFPSGDVPALAAALTRLDASPEEARRLGARGREVVEEEYSLDRQAETMLSIFREVMPSASR